MENSRNKQFISFKLQSILRGGIARLTLLLHPAWDSQPSASFALWLWTQISSWLDDPGSPKTGDPRSNVPSESHCNLTLCHNLYIILLTLSHHVDLSSYHSYSWVQYNKMSWERETEKPHNFIKKKPFILYWLTNSVVIISGEQQRELAKGYIYMYQLFPKLSSHPGCHITLRELQ